MTTYSIQHNIRILVRISLVVSSWQKYGTVYLVSPLWKRRYYVLSKSVYTHLRRFFLLPHCVRQPLHVLIETRPHFRTGWLADGPGSPMGKKNEVHAGRVENSRDA
jgi:hypothetical protein